MNEIAGYFITWTTYETWMPGDARGWRKRVGGSQLPRPLLESWSTKQMTGDAVLLEPVDRETVEDACREHCRHRGWELKAVNARTNHVHVVVIANETPKKVRDQLKANCTRRLRSQQEPLVRDRTWSRGGDCEVLDSDDELFDAGSFMFWRGKINQRLISVVKPEASDLSSGIWSMVDTL